jgi:hypothetical protein
MFKRYAIQVDGKTGANRYTKTKAFEIKKALNALPRSNGAFKVVKP